MSTASETTRTREAPDRSVMDAALQETEKRMMERPELMQMKMEHESIMAECRTRPRDIEAIVAELEKQFEICPEFAMQAIYAKPIGTVFEVLCKCGARYEVNSQWNNRQQQPRREDCEKCGKWDPQHARKVIKKARNLSIRTAEAIAEAYGFNRVHCGVSPIDENHVKVVASFFDYQKLRSWISESIVSKVYTDRFKKVHVTPDDRFYGTVVKAEGSKCVREAILRSVPPALKMRVFARAESIAGKVLTDEEIDKIVAAFAGKGIDQERLESHVGRTRREGWTKADRQQLVEAWNALEANETTIDELFGDVATQINGSNTDAPKVPGGASIEDLVKPPDESTPKAAPGELPETLDPDNEADRAADRAARIEEWGQSFEGAKSITQLDNLVKQAVADKLILGNVKALEHINLYETIARKRLK